MGLLFKREQSNAASGGVNFKLWGTIELDEDEKSIASKYKFDEVILIFADQSGLLRRSIFIGTGAKIAAMVLLYQIDVLQQANIRNRVFVSEIRTNRAQQHLTTDAPKPRRAAELAEPILSMTFFLMIS